MDRKGKGKEKATFSTKVDLDFSSGPMKETVPLPLTSREAQYAAEIQNLKFQLGYKEDQLASKVASYDRLFAALKEASPPENSEGALFGDSEGQLLYSTNMAERMERLLELREENENLSRKLTTAQSQNETLDKDYKHLETNYTQEIEDHKITKEKVVTAGQKQQITQNVLDAVRKDLADEQAENVESKTRIEQLERTEKNLLAQISQLDATVLAHQATILSASRAAKDQDTDNTGISSLLTASQAAVDELQQQLYDAEDRERILVYENENFKDLQLIDRNVRESLGSFVDNPGARFPLNPRTFQPHLRSPTKNRAVSAARSLADELENADDTDMTSEDGTTSEFDSDDARSRRGSDASDRHAGADRSRSASPHNASPKFIVRFIDGLPTAVSSVTLPLTEIVAMRAHVLPLAFLHSGFVTFSEHEPTLPQPQCLSLTVPTYEEIVPSPASSPVTLSYSGYVTEEVEPVSPELPIRIDQGQQTTLPLPVHLTYSGVESQAISPTAIDHNLTHSGIRTIASLSPPLAVVHGHAGTQTESTPVVLTKSGILDVVRQAPTPATVHENAGTQTAEDPVPIPPVLTQTAILGVTSQAPGPAIVHDHAGTQTPATTHGNAGTQTAQDPTPIPAVLTKTRITTINAEEPIVLVLPDAPNFTGVEIIYVDRPYEIANHDPVSCWTAVEQNSWKLICMYVAWLWTIFAVSGVSIDDTPAATAQVPQAPQSAQATAGNDQPGPATPHPAIRIQDTPGYRFKRHVLTTINAQLMHCFIYFLIIWSYRILSQRQVWLNANENTRSFLSDILAYRAYPDEHARLWNPAFWFGEEMVFSVVKTFLLLGQNFDLLQLKPNYIPG